MGKSGYIDGWRYDKFLVYGDFIDYSVMKYDWDTDYAFLGFLEGEDNLHDFYLTGEDFGPNLSGFEDNFAWGALDLTDNLLQLFDGNEEFGAALYLEKILGAEILGDTIVNILGKDEFTIYYNPDLSVNSYLAGLDYKLTGGGYLKASVQESFTVFTWAGTVSSDWDEPDNWDVGEVPGDGDDVMIPADCPPAVHSATSGTSSIDQLICSGQLIISGGSLTIDGDSEEELF